MPTSRPDGNAPVVDMSKWGDRAASAQEVAQYHSALPEAADKPIAISVSADEIGQLFAANADRFGNCNPNVFNQYLLERFKAAGAPVEGTLFYRLAYGAIARVKSNPLAPQDYFQYIWLSPEYALAIANAGGKH